MQDDKAAEAMRRKLEAGLSLADAAAAATVATAAGKPKRAAPAATEPAAADGSMVAAAAAASDPAAEKAKKIRNLQKKIRAIDDLKLRVDKGEVEPTEEQSEKIARRAELEAQLVELQSE